MDRVRASSAAALLLALVVLLAGCGGSAPATTIIKPPTPVSDQVDEPGAAHALARLVGALRHGDADEVADLGDTPSMDAYLRTLVANARAVRLSDVGVRYVDEQGGADVDGSWWATTSLTWRYAGFDARPARCDLSVEFRTTGGGRVTIAAVGNGQGEVPVWLDGPVQVRRTADTLVVAAGSAATADRVSQEATTAVRQVSSFLTDWAHPSLVVEVPPSLAGLARALGTTPHDEAGAAAVTSFVGDGGSSRPIHVYLDPTSFLPLPRLGAQVVLTHEATHVATRAPASTRLPEWLVEGFADYVAQRGLTLSVPDIAGRAISLARRHGVPDQLPAQAQFHSDSGLVEEAAYEDAWLACGVVAAKAGPQGLVDLYRSVDSGESYAHAVRRITGWSPSGLVSAWRARISGLVSGSGSGSGSGTTRPPAR